MRRQTSKIFIISFVLGILVFAGGVSGATNVDSCQTINQSGGYMLTQNLTNSSTCITIEASDVIFDGQDYSITGTGGGTYGIYVYNSSITLDNVTVRNVNVTGWIGGVYYRAAENGSIENTVSSNNIYGIYLDFSSDNNILTNNTANSNNGGIYIDTSSNTILTNNTANSNSGSGIELSSSNNNTITNNTANSNDQYGISLQSSSNNTITNNTLFNNSEDSWSAGIYISDSPGNTFSGNTLTNNTRNFAIEVTGGGSNFNQTIDTSNTVNGKSVYYIKGDSDTTYDSGTDPGWFACINCDNVTVKDLTLTNNTPGLLLWNTNNSNVQNMTIRNNPEYGVYIGDSDNNIFDNDRIIFNCGGDTAIYMTGSDNNIIKNSNISYNTGYGIQMGNSNNNTFLNNNIDSNGQGGGSDGIYMSSSSNNTLTNNTANNNADSGISLQSSSSSNTLTNNTANNNGYSGIYLSSGSNTLTSNTMSGNKYNFFVSGSTASDFVQTIDTSNTIDGKPIIYYVGVSDIVIDSSNTGYIGVVNSVNVTVRDLTLTNNGQGVLFANTSNSLIENFTATNNYDGIHLYSSSNNTLTNNDADNNINMGIYLSTVGSNSVTANTANNNSYGIYLYNSDGNNVTANTANNNSPYGIRLYSADGNNLTDNNANNNSNTGISLASGSKNNTLVNNTATSNDYGIYLLTNTKDNNLTNNIATSNNYGIYLSSSKNNTLTNDNASGNTLWDFYSRSTSTGNDVVNLTINPTISFTSKDIAIKAVSTPATDPFGYSNISKYVNATNNSADSWLYLNMSYADADAAGVSESTIRMWKHNGSWSQVSGTNSVDTAENYVYANITGFSVFAPMGLKPGSIISCTTLNAPGTYTLVQDIVNSGATCINITSSDVIFDGAGYTIDGQDTGGTYGVYVYNTSTALTNVTVKSLVVTDWNYGIYYNNTQNGSIKDSTVNSNNGSGIYLDTSSNNNNLTNNTVTNNTNSGIYLTSSNGSTLTDNNISYNNQGYSGYAGLYLTSSNNNIFTNNYVSNNPENGVKLTSSSSNTFTSNDIVYNCGSNLGLYLGTGSNFNTFDSNNISYNTGDGVQVDSSSNNSFTDNNINSNGNNGIYLVSSNYNTISDGTANNNSVSGVYIYQSSNITVTGVEIHNNTNYGIYDEADCLCSNQTFSYNNISGNAYGLYMKDEDNSIITGNRIWNSSSYGIYLTNTTPMPPNTIYNNFLNNTNNSYDDGTNNWNATLTMSTNIVGGPAIGGNYWAYPNGTGFSEGCTDADGDGICDSYRNITGGSNVDYMPLAAYTGPPPTIIPILPIENQTILNSTVTFMFYSVDDSSTALYYNLTIDGAVNLTNQSAVSGENESVTVSGLSDGSHNWSITIWDGDGSVNTSETRNFTVLTGVIIPDFVVLPIDNTTNGSGHINISDYAPSSFVEQLGVTGYEYLITTNGTTPAVNISVTVFIEAPSGVSEITDTSAIPGFYYQINVNESSWLDNVTRIQLRIYYNISNLNLSASVLESSLRPVRYTGGSWVRLDCDALSGCTATLADGTELYAAGVNTSANYVWANLSNFSVYGMSGIVTPSPSVGGGSTDHAISISNIQVPDSISAGSTIKLIVTLTSKAAETDAILKIWNLPAGWNAPEVHTGPLATGTTEKEILIDIPAGAKGEFAFTLGVVPQDFLGNVQKIVNIVVGEDVQETPMPTETAAPPAPTVTPKPPVTEPPTSPAPTEKPKTPAQPEKPGICGPTIIVGLALIPLILRQKRRLF